MVRLVVLDIDGVITDGNVYITENMKEIKRICFKDIDAIFAIKKMGFKLAFITADNNVNLTKYFYDRFSPDFFVRASNDKLRDLKRISCESGIDFSDICYVGDGYKDIDCIKNVGLGVSPFNAIDEVKKFSKVILKSFGGAGAMVELLNILKSDCGYNWGFFNLLQQHEDVVANMKSDKYFQKCIYKAVDILLSALKNKNKLLFCGNGGSAADAQHLATEFVSRFFIERKSLPAIALSTNTSVLTAIANDYDFEKIFSRQVEGYGNSGDVLIGITTSGTSKNVLKAFKVAKSMGLKTICLTSCVAEDIDCDCLIKIPSKSTPRVQEIHIMIGHYLCDSVEQILFGKAG